MIAIKSNMKGLPSDTIMYCPECGAEYSAIYGDYWALPDDHIFYCCGQSCMLVTKKTIVEAVK